MNYSDDAFVTMLLTMALSPNREEYAHPLTTQELKRIEDKLRPDHLGALINLDIGGLMQRLDLPEEEAYRVYTLLNRSVQLTYTMEKCMRQGIEVVTRFNDEYPRRLSRRMEDAAPPMYYRCGNASLLDTPMLSIIGISGVRTGTEARDSIETLVRNGVRLGYTILTGGEPGVSRVALAFVKEYGGNLIEVLAGDMMAHIQETDVAELLAADRAAVISFEHPEALPTISHAIARSKALFALSEAAFVFNTDGKRGEQEALRSRFSDWIYAWTDYPGNAALIAKGAIPITDIPSANIDALSRHWKNSRSEQLDMYSMFDLNE